MERFDLQQYLQQLDHKCIKSHEKQTRTYSNRELNCQWRKYSFSQNISIDCDCIDVWVALLTIGTALKPDVKHAH